MAGPGCKGIRCGGCGKPERECSCQPAKPTAAAMRAAHALFGETGNAFDREWFEGRAVVIDRETGLPKLQEALRRILAAARGDDDSDDFVIDLAEAALENAEAPSMSCGCRYDKATLQRVRTCAGHGARS